MNNVKFLKDKGKLGDIRYWLGIDEDDDSMDGRINAMSPLTLTRALCGFELGDLNWADEIVNFYIDATHVTKE